MSQKSYIDLDLVIESAPGGHRARILNSPAGEASVDFVLPFSDKDLRYYLAQLGPGRRDTRRRESPEREAAKEFGGGLFDAVFADEVRVCFRQSVAEARRRRVGLRIRLRLTAPDLGDLPWEFLYNKVDNQFLALSTQTPLVRYIDLPQSAAPLTLTPPIRVLVMISSPHDYQQLDVDREWAQLRQAVRELEEAGQLTLERLDEPTLVALRRTLRKREYHIFHFIGHGEFDRNAQDGMLVLQRGRDDTRGVTISGQDVGRALADHEPLRLAVLNACEGARTSRTDPFAGVAQSFVQLGIPAVVAMQFEITDDAAVAFSHEFYASLSEGSPVDAAITEARWGIFSAGGQVEWATPVLHLRSPDGRIFDVERPSGTPAPPARRVSAPASDTVGVEVHTPPVRPPAPPPRDAPVPAAPVAPPRDETPPSYEVPATAAPPVREAPVIREAPLMSEAPVLPEAPVIHEPRVAQIPTPVFSVPGNVTVATVDAVQIEPPVVAESAESGNTGWVAEPTLRWRVLAALCLGVLASNFWNQVSYTRFSSDATWSGPYVLAVVAISALVAGFTVDRAGILRTLWRFALPLSVMSALVAAAAMATTDVPANLAGLLIEFSSEWFLVASLVALAAWFQGQKVSLAFGVLYASTRLTGFAAPAASYLPTPILLLAFVGALVFSLFAYARLDRSARERVSANPVNDKGIPEGDSRFRRSYWLLVVLGSVLSCAASFATNLRWMSIGSYGEDLFGISDPSMSVGVLAGLVLGSSVDRTGRRSMFTLVTFVVLAILAPGLSLWGAATPLALGLASALATATLWVVVRASVASVVERPRLGRAYGLMLASHYLASIPGTAMVWGWGIGFFNGMWVLSTLGAVGAVLVLWFARMDRGRVDQVSASATGLE